jgi:leucyl-tRNA synthetase
MSEDSDGDEALDLEAVEAKWRDEWQQRGLHEADPRDDEDAFFVTYPYSYMNARAHVGHAYTMLRCDMMARYQRMQGSNVLFPFAYHVTGTPIVAAANRVEEGEETILQQLRDQGIGEDEIDRFSDPMAWIDYFPEQWRQDVDDLGLMVDWRRQFHTTDLNPYYDAFIRWQFRRLKDEGLVRRGEHPVVWDPEADSVLTDHDRQEGEGATPEEFTLVKLRDVDDPDRVFVAATLRPETMFGQTNAFVHPDEAYTEVRVGDERWVVAEEAAHKFRYQFDDVEATDVTVEGRELVGTAVRAPAVDREVPVLPAWFVSADTGTGVVTSVPSDAPDDHRAIEDLREDPDRAREAGLEDPSLLDDVEAIPIIDTPDVGDTPAVDAVEERGIGDQSERAALEEATDEVYQRGFYEGTMKGDLPVVGGEPVQEAKERVQDWLVEEGEAEVFYDLTEKVVARSLAEGVVKIVDDQWFMAYGDEGWKRDVERGLDETVTLYPEDVRAQFDHVVDWLDDWACTRATGLGTKLPWDEQWIIESLSDSTIYMAYYTIAHHLEDGDIEAEDVRDNDAAFDYVFLGEGTPGEAAQGTLTEDRLERMRAEFEHFYPVDYRNSGKDLVQNHLTFMLFNHVALFEEEHWPRGISVNGWVTIGGEKMSKSRGNFITLRQALEDYGATATRLALANAGEGLDDANFEPEFAERAPDRVRSWYREVTTEPEDARTGEKAPPEVWFEARLADVVEQADRAFEEARFRTALRAGFFDLTRAWNRYKRRSLGRPHRDTRERFADVAVRLAAPVTPHAAEEAWQQLGGEGPVAEAAFPEAQRPEGADVALAAEDLVDQVLDDTRDIVQATGEAPELVRVFTAPAWKHRVLEEARSLDEKGELDPGTLTGRVMQDEDVKQHGSDAADFAKDLAVDVDRGQVPDVVVDEAGVLEGAAAYLEAELDCTVEIVPAEEADGVEDGGKADRAEPGRPGIYLAT